MTFPDSPTAEVTFIGGTLHGEKTQLRLETTSFLHRPASEPGDGPTTERYVKRTWLSNGYPLMVLDSLSDVEITRMAQVLMLNFAVTPAMPWTLRDGQVVIGKDIPGLFDLEQPGYAPLYDLTVGQVLDVLRQRNGG